MGILMGIVAVIAVVVTGKLTYQDLYLKSALRCRRSEAQATQQNRSAGSPGRPVFNCGDYEMSQF